MQTLALTMSKGYSAGYSQGFMAVRFAWLGACPIIDHSGSHENWQGTKAGASTKGAIAGAAAGYEQALEKTVSSELPFGCQLPI